MFSSFQNITRSVLILVFCVLFLIGCSSGGHNTSPIVPDESQGPSGITENSASTGQNTHYLLMYGLIDIDATNPDDVKVEMVPEREGEFHLNILKFLEIAPCTNCLKIVGHNIPGPGLLNVDIEITHPYADMKFTAFDVRGILMRNGSRLFPVSGLTWTDSTLGDGELLNPEGFTQLYNGSTLGMAGDFYTYFQGKNATDTVPDADLNGFIRHISNDPANTRNALYAGDSVTRTYCLAMPSGEKVLGYAVDASWDIPLVDPVTDPMTQFPPTANCIEPWKIEVLGNHIVVDGSTTLTIDVYDWQGKDTIANVLVECPELFNGQVAASFHQDGAGYTRYEAIVSNDNNAPVGSYQALISAEAVENATSPEWMNLTAYTIQNIDIWLPAGSGNLMWAKRAGGESWVIGYGITTLSDNSTVVGGVFYKSAMFGPGEPNETALTSGGHHDVFIARYNPDGTLAWVTHAGGTSNWDYVEGYGITSLSDDSTVITGCVHGEVTFGAGEENETVVALLGGIYCIFTARYNSDGTLAWVKCASGKPTYVEKYEAKAITSLSDDSTVITGKFIGPVTFGKGEPNETVLTPFHFYDIFIARYNPDGTLAWAKQADGACESNWNFGITALMDDSVVVTSTFLTKGIFGPGEPNETILTPVDGSDIFIARYNPDGTLAWAKSAGGTEYDYGMGITALPDNSVGVTGDFWGSATFGFGEPNETTLTSDYKVDLFVARYSQYGTLIWAKRAGGGNLSHTCGYGITTLSDNSTVVTGVFRESVTFGPGEPNQTILTADGAIDIFFARYNPNGTLSNVKCSEGPDADFGYAITTLSDNSTAVTGIFELTTTFGPGEPNETVLAAAGEYDIFVARFMP
jgi:hypothetical protein